MMKLPAFRVIDSNKTQNVSAIRRRCRRTIIELSILILQSRGTGLGE